MSKHPEGMFDRTIFTTGAVLKEDCPTFYSYCKCGKCKICGYSKHTAIHGPFAKTPVAGSTPYGHEFQNARGEHQ